MDNGDRTMTERIVDALRRAKERILEAERGQRDAIAVVGMACRFPGGPTLADYWRVLVEGSDMIREIPSERLIGRWPEDAPRWAGLLDDIAGFDAEFFGISAVEATAMDPQQRLALELTWEALEHARILPAQMRGSNTGVFIGLTGSEYLERIERRDLEDRTAYDVTGVMPSVVSGRIAYAMGFQGPAVSMDTACSSSLVAIHLACQSLRERDCNLALAGGVKLICSEHYLEFVALTRGLSQDGRCKTFDAGANGFVLGEGGGILALKRLADAQRDGDRILGVVAGSAINQDGRSANLTAPNARAQARVLQRALQRAALRAEEIDYIECHGTGTPLGDPIEIEGIKAAYASADGVEAPLWLGAAKTNIGHLEAAAGVAGCIKVLLSLMHEHLPSNLHLRQLNPRIQIENTRLRPLAIAQPWPRQERRLRRAGVSSFGMSGTNAHIIFEEVEKSPGIASGGFAGSESHVPIVISAHGEKALHGQASRLLAWLRTGEERRLCDIGYSLMTTRSVFEHCVVLTGRRLEEQLSDLLEGTGSPSYVHRGDDRGLLYMFTGQGSQRAGMGKAVWDAFPQFRSAIEDISACFEPHLGRPLIDVMFGAPGSSEAQLLDGTGWTQPALFALEVGLARLLASWGIVPTHLVGHSIGELAAAHVAGVFSLVDACKIVAARGRLMQALPTGGKMIAVQSSAEDVMDALNGCDRVSVAAYNGPLSLVLSGDDDQVAGVEAKLRERGVRVKALKVSHAFHSHRMDPMLSEFEAVLRTVTFEPPQLPVVSNLTGEFADAKDVCEPRYWVRQVREPVHFHACVKTLVDRGVGTWLELGPRPVLSLMAKGAFGDRAGIQIQALLDRDDEVGGVATAMGVLHCRSIAIDWERYFAPVAARKIDLPTYAFQRSRFWIDVTESRGRRHRSLIGERVPSPLPAHQFHSVLDPRVVRMTTATSGDALHVGVVLGMLSQAAQHEWGAGVGIECSLACLPTRVDGPLTCSMIFEAKSADSASYRLFTAYGDAWELMAWGDVRIVDVLDDEASPDSKTLVVPRSADADFQPVHPEVLDAVVSAVGGGRNWRVTAIERMTLRGALPHRVRVAGMRHTDERMDIDAVGVGGIARLRGVTVVDLGHGVDATTVAGGDGVEHTIMEIVARTLGVTPTLDDDLGRFGFDSLSLIAFMAGMQKAFGMGMQQILRGGGFSVKSLGETVRRGDSAGTTGAPSYRRPQSVSLEVLELPLPADVEPGRPCTAKLVRLPEGMGELEIVVVGDRGPVVVLLPPFNAEWQIWRPVEAELEACTRVLVNYPGVGRGRAARDLEHVAQLAAWTCWALDALGIEQVSAILGWSLGGFVAQQIALHRPDLVGKLVLLNTTAHLESARSVEGVTRMVMDLHGHLEAELATLGAERAAALRALVHGTERRSFDVGFYRALVNWDARLDVDAITQPTLIVAGRRDTVTPVSHSHFLHEHIAGSRLLEVDSGHYAPIFATATIVAAVREWVGLAAD